ncbi:ORF6N domain-containing protein [bacterium]|nr:ORF6N domain-containing protein [bacterium]
MPIERVERLIHLIRDEKVMLDSDLADLYGVETKVLMQAVKRNVDRFPSDFMFQLSKKEFNDLKSQFVTSSSWGGKRKLPYAFTEQGVAMLSSVLRTERAIKVNIAIMRIFVQLRQIMQSNEKLSKQLENMEKKYDEQFRIVFKAIQQLMTPPAKKQRKMGFDAG